MNYPYQQQVNGGMPAGIPPQNNMALAIVATVLAVVCCGIQSIISLTLGIIAIVKANSVNQLFMSGRELEAMKAAKTAKTLSIISICVTVVMFIIAFIVMLLTGTLSDVLNNM